MEYTRIPPSYLPNLDLNASYTIADYLSWPTEESIQLIRGRIQPVSLGADGAHGLLRSSILDNLFEYLPRGENKEFEVWLPRFDIYLPIPDTVVQADLSICHRSTVVEIGCVGVPAWVVEIINADSLAFDTGIKKDLYQEAGLPELMLVFPFEKRVEVYQMENGRYGEPIVYDKPGQKWAICSVPGAHLAYDQIFSDQ